MKQCAASEIIQQLKDEAQQLPDVIAPVLRRRSRVSCNIARRPYLFSVSVPEEGWWLLHPENTIAATATRKASLTEIRRFLSLLPQFQAIALRRLDDSTWLTYPYNETDAIQRQLQFPMATYLVSDNVTPLSRISCRVMGNLLLYERRGYHAKTGPLLEELNQREGVPTKLYGLPKSFYAAYSILLSELAKQDEEIKRQEREERRKTFAGRIEDAVSYLGGNLIGFTERGSGYEVAWEDEGVRHSVIIESSLQLVTAGICLSGTDRQHSLTSAIAVMRGEDEY